MDAPAIFSLDSYKGNIFLIGFMGSGKTHWGKIWAASHQCNFIDLDDLIEKNHGKTVVEIFDSKGEDYFRKIEADTLRSCASLQNTIIACGGGTPCFFDSMTWMNEQGITIYITCSPAEILKRVSVEQEKRPLFKKLNEAELLFFIKQKIREREPFYSRATYIVSSQQLTPGSLAEIIAAKPDNHHA